MCRILILYSAVLLLLSSAAARSPGQVLRISAETTGVQPSSPTLLITEFQYDPSGQDRDREWIELANVSVESIAVGGYGVGDEELSGAGEGMMRFPSGSRIEAGQTVVIARSAAGFRALFGLIPDYEMRDTDTAVPDMLVDKDWATGELALANDGDEILLLDDQDHLIDAVNYGKSRAYFDPAIPLAVPGHSLERLPASCDSDSAADWQMQSAPSPGQIQLGGDCVKALGPPASGRPRLSIGAIQGAGERSPFHNQVVTFQGVVTGLLEDQNAAGIIYYTLFVQDPPDAADGDPATSDALAVFTGRRRPQFEIGDLVTVRGQVTEFFGLTEIDDSGLDLFSGGTAASLPQPVTLDVPTDPDAANAYFESLEGMLVQTAADLPVVGATHSGCGFALNSDAARERPLRHSDDDRLPPAFLVLNYSDVDCSDLPALKTDDLVGGVRGPLTYHFDRYKVVQQDPSVLQINPAPLNRMTSPPLAEEGELRIATLNLEDFLELGGESAGRASKTNKLALTISSTLGCPQIVAVQEVGSARLLSELAEATAVPCGFLYQVSHLDSADSRGIDVALLSDPGTVSVEALILRQTCSPLATSIVDESIQCPAAEEPLFSRAPLEVTLRVSGEQLMLLINHFKSKRGGVQETAPRRRAQADHVHKLVKQRLASNPQSGVIVLGDFNDYDRSATWQHMQEDGILYDVMQHVPVEERYTYVFDGEAQLIDGILVSPALIQRIGAVTIPHINADYPAAWASDHAYLDTPYRASDHDPVLLTIRPAPQEQRAEATPSPADQPQMTRSADAAGANDSVTPNSAAAATADRTITAASTALYLLPVLALLILIAVYFVFKARD